MNTFQTFPALPAAHAVGADSSFNRRASRQRARHVLAPTESVRAVSDAGVFFPVDLLDRWQPRLTRYHE